LRKFGVERAASADLEYSQIYCGQLEARLLLKLR